MNRHDLSDKHMELQKAARQEEEIIEEQELEEKSLANEDAEEQHWRQKMPPIKRKPPK